MKQCNQCSNRKCDRLRMHRAKKRQLTLKELQGDCPMYKRVPLVTEKLVDLALGNNVQGVHDVLNQFPWPTDHLIDGGKKRGKIRRNKRHRRNTGSDRNRPVRSEKQPSDSGS